MFFLGQEAKDFTQALANGRLANEGYSRCRRFVDGWLAHADEHTGLIPHKTTKEPYWNAQDNAADNYPFMVLTASLTDRALLEGRMLDMLKTETRLTSRIDSLPDDYDFQTRGFRTATPDLNRILFGASEYIKDGLLPLTEWLGASPWRDRMIGMLDDVWKHAAVDTPNGKIPSTNVELNGEMLQVLSRAYWMTRQRKYLDWAVRLGDYYLLGDHHPTRDMERLRLRDHGCEIVSGLCELYATVHFAEPEKQAAYRAPLCEMLDRILECGRNDDGLFYNVIDPVAGKAVNTGVADTWGYNLNAYYTVYLIDGTRRYRDATLAALGALKGEYENYPWEGRSADGYADAIEGALNLHNREPLPSVASWIDSEIQVMWVKQRPDGVIEGWHGDGNFARTTIMYCLWKTQGARVEPWRADVIIGAVPLAKGIALALRADAAWKGRLFIWTARK